MSDSPAPVQIDIISDVMCPWCLIGKRRLEKALALRPGTPVDIRWRPYQLDPTIPREGMDRKEYLANKFGSIEQARERYANIVTAGADEGVPFAFDAIKRSPNTIDAHRLIRWAATAGCQEDVVERLFKMYFLEGRDIGDPDVLNEAAAEAGMDTALVSELLASDADRDLVEKEVATAREIGVRGVPCFIVANRYVVMGAEQPDVIAGAIDMAVKDIENGVGETG